jgi:hypothetical protein
MFEGGVIIGIFFFIQIEIFSHRAELNRMNALFLIEQLKAASGEPWDFEQLYPLVWESLSRWRAARDQFKVAFCFPPDIRAIVPDFRLSSELAAIAPADDSSRLRTIAIGFLSWATCSITSEVANPYEPLLYFVYHGGKFSTEHGFLDVHTPDGKRCGIPYAFSTGTTEGSSAHFWNKFNKEWDAMNRSAIIVRGDALLQLSEYKLYIDGNVHGTGARFAALAPPNSVYCRLQAGVHRVVLREKDVRKLDRLESNTIEVEIHDDEQIAIRASLQNGELFLEVNGAV